MSSKLRKASFFADKHFTELSHFDEQQLEWYTERIELSAIYNFT